MKGLRRSRLGLLLVASAAAIFVALPGAGTSKGAFNPGKQMLAHLSQQVAIRYWLANPDQAPVFVDRLSQTLKRAKHAGGAQVKKGPKTQAFNFDDVGLPQNEESVAACRSNTMIVLGGTNDYRFILNPTGDATGWHYSNDGGNSLTNEGFLPPLGLPTGEQLGSGGDPVDRIDVSCTLYAGSLNYNVVDGSPHSNAVGVYRTTPATLESCAGGDDFSCWPTQKVVAENAAGHFLDKEWIDVGVSGGTEYVWVTWTDFDMTVPGVPFNASIMASRCTADLSSCTAPQNISGSDPDVQFSDVNIGPDGRTYLTWSEIQGEINPGDFPDGQQFIHKLRIAPAGSTSFGPTRVIATEDQPLPFGGFLQGNDFRTATYPKNAISWIGHARIFVIWDACSTRQFGTLCEEPVIKLTYSDDDGASWSTPNVISAGGVNYFPTISDNTEGKLAAAWYTNRHDSFDNAQDVEMVKIDASSGKASKPDRLTHPSNETEADPLLGGFFIGDYFETFAYKNKAWVHFNANYRQEQFLGNGPAVNQQDNFLIKTGL